jgi:hypothetical protein
VEDCEEVCDWVWLDVCACVAVPDILGVCVSLRVCDWLADWVSLGVNVWLCEGETDALCDCVWLAVPEILEV